MFEKLFQKLEQKAKDDSEETKFIVLMDGRETKEVEILAIDR